MLASLPSYCSVTASFQLPKFAVPGQRIKEELRAAKGKSSRMQETKQNKCRRGSQGGAAGAPAPLREAGELGWVSPEEERH